MSKDAPKTATCKCGQVVFDLAHKKTGHALSCPWCSKHYVLNEALEIEETPASKDKSRKSTSGKSRRHKDKPTRSETPKRPASSTLRRASSKKEKKDSEAPSSTSGRQAQRERPAKHDQERPGTKTSASSKKFNTPNQEIRSKSGEVHLDAKEIATDDLLADLDNPFEIKEDADAVAAESSDFNAKAAADARSQSDRVDRGPFPERASDRTRSARSTEDDVAKPRPLNLEKMVLYMFGAAVPLFGVGYAIYLWWGIKHGLFYFKHLTLFGYTLRGDNPWVWVGGLLFGAITFFFAWVAYTYFFVYLKIKRRKDASADRHAQRDPCSQASPRSTRKEAK